MTGGWAATNTVREALDDAIHSRTYGAIIEHDPMCAALMGGRPCNCTVARAKAAIAALALVETALAAAADLESRIVDGPDWSLGQVFNSAGRLAAALRAVREGA